MPWLYEAEIRREILRRFVGNMTKILREIPWLNKTDRRGNFGNLHTEATLK